MVNVVANKVPKLLITHTPCQLMNEMNQCSLMLHHYGGRSVCRFNSVENHKRQLSNSGQVGSLTLNRLCASRNLLYRTVGLIKSLPVSNEVQQIEMDERAHNTFEESDWLDLWVCH